MAALPALILAGVVPVAAVVALPTRPGDEGPRVLGQPPLEVAALLAREKAKGEPGELIALPVEDRVLLMGTGDGGPVALRKAGAAVARRAKQQASLALDLRRLELSAEGLQALAEGLLLSSYGFTLKPPGGARPLTRIAGVVPTPGARRESLQRPLAVISGVAAPRAPVNPPPLQKNPAWLASQ